MALRGIMQSDPEQALPIIEKMLTGTNSPKVKDRALFVLSQSHSARAREIIAGVAKGNANPDLQLRAIRYIGIMGGPDNRQILADVYKTSNDAAVKRVDPAQLHDRRRRERLFAAAKSETDASLRGEAIRQLGVMHASSELAQLYQTETSVEVKKSILQAMFVGGDSRQADRAGEEREGSGAAQDGDPQPRADEAARHHRSADRRSTRRTRRSTSRRRSINALFLQSNATGLVDARPRREERRDEEGHRLEAVDHEVEGSDRLSDGAAEVSARRARIRAAGLAGFACVLCPAFVPAVLLRRRPLGAGAHREREDRDAVGGAGARARGARGGGARRRDLDRLPRADGRRAAADVLLRHDLRLRRSRAACAGSRAAAACR